MRLPWGRAPRAALSSPVTVLVAVVTGLVVAFVAASTVFHVSASGSAAVRYVSEKRCPDDTGLSIERGGGSYFAPTVESPLGIPDEVIRETAARHGLDLVRQTRYASTLPLSVDGHGVDGRLVARDGAQQHVRPTAGGATTEGVWVPAELAEKFGVEVGDELVVGTKAGPMALPVTAVYPTITEPVDGFWCSQRSEVIKLIAIPEGQIRPPVVLVAPETMDRLVAGGLVVQAERIQITASRLPTDRESAVRHAAAVAAVRAELEPRLHGRDAVEQATINDRAAYPAASGDRALQAVGGSLVPLTGIALLVGLAAV
ncbi:MAG TPA: hypothetical protein VGD67_12515, partial [Pseudonocardiaceae bacterium]